MTAVQDHHDLGCLHASDESAQISLGNRGARHQFALARGFRKLRVLREEVIPVAAARAVLAPAMAGEIKDQLVGLPNEITLGELLEPGLQLRFRRIEQGGRSVTNLADAWRQERCPELPSVSLRTWQRAEVAR